jgi:hypothetical protein
MFMVGTWLVQGSVRGDGCILPGSAFWSTKLLKMMDPTKIAPFDNIDLVILRKFFDFPLFS